MEDLEHARSTQFHSQGASMIVSVSNGSATGGRNGVVDSVRDPLITTHPLTGHPSEVRAEPFVRGT